MNIKDEILLLLPSPDCDVADKYNVYLFGKDFRNCGLIETGNLDHAVELELPAFAHFLLNEWQIPDWIEKDARFGIASYHNPDATKSIFQASPEASLTEFIYNVMIEKGRQTYGEDKSNEMYRLISEDVRCTKYNRKIWEQVKSNSFGHKLGQLRKGDPEHITVRKDSNGINLWTITCPENVSGKSVQELLKDRWSDNIIQ
jgi:hypothetical protein